MKVINLFGQPSAGKSTTAAGLFFKMKTLGYSVELVTEYAKDMVWRGLPLQAFDDQLYITAKQNAKLHRLKGQVEFVISDSPLLLGLIYAPDQYYKTFEPFLLELFNSYHNINFLLERTKDYNPVGRNQTKEEADQIASFLENFLINKNISHSKIKGDKDAPDNIFDNLTLF
jgi:nicotinamide riboside kinase